MASIAIPKAKFPFDHQKLSAQVQIAEVIVQKAKASTVLPAADPTLVSLDTATSTLGEAEQTVLGLQKQLKAAIAVRDDKQLAFHKACLAFVGRINGLALGDPTAIVSVGLSTVLTGKHTAAPAAMIAPLSLKASAGPKPGEVNLRWKRVKGVGSYIVQRSPDPPTSTSFAQVALLTPSKVLLEGQPSSVPLWYRVAALGASGQGPWSDPVPVIAH